VSVIISVMRGVGGGVAVDGPEGGIDGEDVVGVCGSGIGMGVLVVVVLVVVVVVVVGGEDVVWLEGEDIVRLRRGCSRSGGVRVGAVRIEVEMIHGECWGGEEDLASEREHFELNINYFNKCIELT
jgi:hypothetical protein